MKVAGADEVAVEKLADLHKGTSGKVGIGYAKVHHIGLLVWVLRLLLGELLLFVFKAHAADVSHCDGGKDDACDTEGVGTSVARGDLRGVALWEDGADGFRGGTKAGGVGHGAVERAYHHGQVVLVACVKENVVASEHHQHVENDGGCGETVERHTVFLETFKEAWSHLHADHEDEEDEAEVLAEIEDGDGGCEMDVACHDAGEQHKGDTE